MNLEKWTESSVLSSAGFFYQYHISFCASLKIILHIFICLLLASLRVQAENLLVVPFKLLSLVSLPHAYHQGQLSVLSLLK